MKRSRSVPPLAVLAAILVVSFLPRLATLRQVTLPSGETISYHIEGDEMVFKTLIEQVDKNFFNYSLQRTPILPELNQQNYDLPIFFHPPAFVYTALLLSFLPLPLVPVLMNLATIALVFFIGRRLYGDEGALWAAFLAAVCPVTWFLSQKIWLDNMLILTTTASVAAAIWAADRDREWAYVVAGGVFGLAILTKVTAVLMILPLTVLIRQRDKGGMTFGKAAAFLLPVCLLAGWWELTLKTFNNQWLPSAFPNPEMIAKFPFVAEIVARPWYFYLVNVVAISPVYVLALDALRQKQLRDLAPALWFLAFWAAMTGFGLRGGGYQTRYVAPAYPALALLAAEPIPRLKTAGLLVVVALIGYGMSNGLLYAVIDTPNVADFQASAAGLVIRNLREVPRPQ
jgi:hypothetical protein